MRRWAVVTAGALAALALAGCGGETHQDLRNWMAEQGKNVRGKVEPLPQVKPYEPFTYNAFDLPDPFRERKVKPVKTSTGLSPDLTRRKEPLEAYPLESLNMVGTLQKDKQVYALVRTPEKDLYQVKPGNHMGQNFGTIVGVSESEITLKELIQDSGGDWAERSSTLQLIEPKQEKK